MKIIRYLSIIIFFVFFASNLIADENNFYKWLNNFKIYALKQGVSEKNF